MTPERMQILNSIGFEWELKSEWNERFNELKEYKEEYKNSNVTQKENKQLGNWVSTQRTEYKKFKKNQKSAMTLERINMLNSIGFQWELSKWNERFNELKEYKEEYGVANVQRSENKELGNWVNKQRAEYKKFKKNGKGKITHERVDLLNSIGFQWECRRGPVPRS